MPLSEPHYPILVTGARGLVGVALAPHLVTADGGRHSAPGGIPNASALRLTDLEELDVTDEEAVRSLVRDFRPRTVFHLAAWTQVDRAESHAAEVRRLNVEAVGHVARAAAEVGALLVHMSTDFIFDGTKSRPYVEEDPPRPQGVYADSKARSEQVVREVAPEGHLIVRTAWLYGEGRHNFVDTILAAARKAASGRTEPGPLWVVTDQVGNPTWSRDLARAVVALVEAGARGTFHACGSGAASRFELAREVVRAAGLNVPVEPITSDQLRGKAPRPHRAVLSTEKLERTISFRFPDWKESVWTYVRTQRGE
jgi:dTDP-4-dehydrorhamnose reductase